ncbi:hypothetical protein ATS75_00395 [Pseudoalteromonas sp. H105]|nr:hypothetical protein ATS75_00395 [Pseudoalteromonas sp. H105]
MNLRLDTKILKLWPKLVDHFIALISLRKCYGSETSYFQSHLNTYFQLFISLISGNYDARKQNRGSGMLEKKCELRWPFWLFLCIRNKTAKALSAIQTPP